MKFGMTLLYVVVLLVISFVALIRFTDFKFLFIDSLINAIKRLENKISSLDSEIRNFDKEQSEKEFLLIVKYMGRKVAKGLRPEVILSFDGSDEKYKIVGFKDHVTFQRCNSDENIMSYNRMDELYESSTIDGICLKNDWNRISSWDLLAKK